MVSEGACQPRTLMEVSERRPQKAIKVAQVRRNGQVRRSLPSASYASAMHPQIERAETTLSAL
jgi:hypothetical protein